MVDGGNEGVAEFLQKLLFSELQFLHFCNLEVILIILRISLRTRICSLSEPLSAESGSSLLGNWRFFRFQSRSRPS